MVAYDICLDLLHTGYALITRWVLKQNSPLNVVSVSLKVQIYGRFRPALIFLFSFPTKNFHVNYTILSNTVLNVNIKKLSRNWGHSILALDSFNFRTLHTWWSITIFLLHLTFITYFALNNLRLIMCYILLALKRLKYCQL